MKKNNFVLLKLIIAISIFQFSIHADSQEAKLPPNPPLKPKITITTKPIAKIKITDEIIAKATHCEVLLRSASNDEVVARKVFLNSLNTVLKEYINQNLFTCFYLLDPKLRSSIKFSTDLIAEYPILFGDLEEPAHSDRSVITAAAVAMNKFEFCHLPILELAPFVQDKGFKESLIKVNPACVKYTTVKENKALEEKNNEKITAYFRKFIPNHASSFSQEERQLQENYNAETFSSYNEILNTLKSRDSEDDWFYKRFADSSSYAEIIVQRPESFKVTNFTERDFERIMDKVEAYNPTQIGQKDPNITLAINSIYRFYSEDPNNLIFKNLKSRLWTDQNIDRIFHNGESIDKVAEYIDSKIINDSRVLQLFIQYCNPYMNGKSGYSQGIDFWEKLKPEILQSRIEDILPCVQNYSKFFEKNKYAENKIFILKVLSSAKKNAALVEYPLWIKELYRGLGEALKNDKEIVSAFFINKNANIYSLIPENLKTDPQIKLLSLKYSNYCSDLIRANPDDKVLLMDIFFPERINHDVEFLFEKSAERKLEISKNAGEDCFTIASDRLKGDLSVALPILERFPQAWIHVQEPASSHYEVIKKAIAKLNQDRTCVHPQLKLNVSKLSKAQSFEVIKLNISCLVHFPQQFINNDVYNLLISETIPVSILNVLPVKYKLDFNVLDKIEPLYLNKEPITSEELESVRSGEDGEYYAGELKEEKSKIDAEITAYNEKLFNFLSPGSLSILLQKKAIEDLFNYLKSHFYFVRFRFLQGQNLFTRLDALETQYLGKDFPLFKDQTFWVNLAAKVVKEKLLCLQVKDFFELHSDFWEPSEKDIVQKLNCVKNLAKKVPVVLAPVVPVIKK
ncbi:MAG: hypothetical protein H7336_05530 [Bacteriovorax sp.]|nr:hypothetical protein [Bacteriovorax sp.]